MAAGEALMWNSRDSKSSIVGNAAPDGCLRVLAVAMDVMSNKGCSRALQILFAVGYAQKQVSFPEHCCEWSWRGGAAHRTALPLLLERQPCATKARLAQDDTFK